MDTTRNQSGAAGMMRYEEFDPKFRWTEDKDSKTLVLDVPQFKKENLKVHLINHCRIKVSGLCPLEDNKCRRFSMDFQVPQDCDTGRIRSRFDNSSLFVIMPLDQPVDTRRAAATKEEKKEVKKDEKNSSKTTTTTTTGTDSKPAAEVIGGRLQEKIQHRYSKKSKVLKVVVVILLLLGLGSYIIMKQPSQLQQVFETEEDEGISQWISHP